MTQLQRNVVEVVVRCLKSIQTIVIICISSPLTNPIIVCYDIRMLMAFNQQIEFTVHQFYRIESIRHYAFDGSGTLIMFAKSTAAAN